MIYTIYIKVFYILNEKYIQFNFFFKFDHDTYAQLPYEVEKEGFCF